MSNFEDLYRDIILDHYRSPRNRGELAAPPAHRVEGFNPLCGDEVVIYLDVRDGELRDIKMSGHGCSISQSSSSLMTAAVKGKSLEGVRQLVDAFLDLMTVGESGPATDASHNGDDELRRWGELAALRGVVKFPVRIKCATLAWHTLLQGLNELSPP